MVIWSGSRWFGAPSDAGFVSGLGVGLILAGWALLGCGPLLQTWPTIVRGISIMENKCLRAIFLVEKKRRQTQGLNLATDLRHIGSRRQNGKME
jgi:hypothetical protein